jgi:hypothetical protein
MCRPLRGKRGVAHIAGNVNGRTIRRFPVVTEVCVFYQRRFEHLNHRTPDRTDQLVLPGRILGPGLAALDPRPPDELASQLAAVTR